MSITPYSPTANKITTKMKEMLKIILVRICFHVCIEGNEDAKWVLISVTFVCHIYYDNKAKKVCA